MNHLDNKVMRHLLRFCTFDENGTLIANPYYSAIHRVRFKGKLITLKSLHFYYLHGAFPQGKLVDSSGENKIVDSSLLTYIPNGV